MVALSNFAAMAFSSVFALFALGPMGLGAAGYGVFLALFGMGSLVGTAIAAPGRAAPGYGADAAASARSSGR